MFAGKTTLSLFLLSFFAVCCLHLLEPGALPPEETLFAPLSILIHILYALGLTAMSWLFFGMVYVIRFLASRIENSSPKKADHLFQPEQGLDQS